MREANPERSLQHAIQCQQAGRLAEAEAIYRRILESTPDHHKVLFLLGISRVAQGDFAGAVEIFDRAIAAAPGFAEYHHGRGGALMGMGRFDLAADAFEQAVRLKPGHVDANRQLGRVLTQLGRAAEGAQYLTKAQALSPEDAKIAFDLANALRRSGRLAEALAVATKAVEAEPDEAWGHNILGLAFLDRRDFDEAAAHFRRAIALRPDLAEAYSNLAHVAELKGQPTEAVDLLQAAIKIRPSYAGARHNLGLALLSTGAYAEGISSLRKSMELQPGSASTHSSLLYALNFQVEITPEAVFAEHQRWAEIHAAEFQRAPQVHENDRTPDRPLRIGYISGDLHQHPVASFFEPILREHDRRQFLVTCYCATARSDEVTQRLRSHAGEWREIHGASDAEVAAMIQRDGIDVLVDLSGHTERNRLLVFARKPTPVQVSYLGYPNTTGMRAMDYRLTDAWADPPGVTDAWNTEKLERLPLGFLCYGAPMECPEPKRVGGPAAGRAVVFGSFNRVEKLNPRSIATWAKILMGLPNSRLVLKNQCLADRRLCAILHQAFQSYGIDPGRVELRASQSQRTEHLAAYGEIDIALDTFPYNGTATSCEAMWMGVPVISLAGRTHASRVGLSLLSQLGLAELAAASEEQYVAAAVTLASNFQWLDRPRLEMRQRMARSSLMDASRHAREIEAAYRRMWRTWCTGATA